LSLEGSGAWWDLAQIGSGAERIASYTREAKAAARESRGDLGFTAVVREVEAADGDKGGKRWARVSLVVLSLSN
jgi:hypothetical protein